MAKNPPKTANTLMKRPPVVAIMGHIDHGKSTLLDYIRKSNIVEKEAGGITQHVGAYEVIHKGENGKDEKITFIDTPGHEAFSGIRSRGANTADIAILVVSGEEGVKPQTLEALNAIKKAETPYIVAITKIDSPKADIERTKGNLAEHEIYIEGYGGDTPWVAVSGKTGKGIPEMLDLILLAADLEDLKADPGKNAEGVVVEGHLDTRKGISAVLLIKDGTLRQGDSVVCGKCIVTLRYLEDTRKNRITEATFSSPVVATGWSFLPEVGSAWKSFGNKKEALSFIESQNLTAQKPLPKADVKDRIVLNLILKADAVGSLEALEQEIKKIKSEKIHLETIDRGVGEISLNDVKRIEGLSNSFILGFNVKTDREAKALSERSGINIQTFDIIYKLVEWVADEVKAKTPKEEIAEVRGKAKIQKVFSKNKDKQIVGGRVEEGSIFVGEDVKILRRDAEIGKGKVRELQQQKMKATEAKNGTEFGAMIASNIEIAPGDRIEGYKIVEK